MKKQKFRGNRKRAYRKHGCKQSPEDIRAGANEPPRGEKELLEKKRVEFRKAMEQFEKLWCGSGYLDFETSRALNDLQGAISRHAPVVAGRLGVQMETLERPIDV